MNFFCLKWGTKYDAKYVNRLYGSLKKNCQVDFTFTCYTDDPTGLREEVEVKNIKELRPYDTNRVFTYEKLILLEKHEKGIWIDLDVLIHKDITDLVTRDVESFTMIWNDWNDYEYKTALNWGKGTACHVNSSFVRFEDAEWLVRYTHDNWDKIEFTYKSLDKYLFYQHFRKNKLAFWEPDIFSNYNVQGQVLKNRVTLFNTSHVHANNLKDRAIELHEAEPNVQRIWKSYSL